MVRRHTTIETEIIIYCLFLKQKRHIFLRENSVTTAIVVFQTSFVCTATINTFLNLHLQQTF